ncbi:MAG: hypothetical protein ACLPVY_27660 [Acidimicrobiia bacterium]
MDQMVVCEHCGERLFVLAQQLPIVHVEREAGDGRRLFLLIGADGWLVHRYIDAEE